MSALRHFKLITTLICGLNEMTHKVAILPDEKSIYHTEKIFKFYQLDAMCARVNAPEISENSICQNAHDLCMPLLINVK